MVDKEIQKCHKQISQLLNNDLLPSFSKNYNNPFKDEDSYLSFSKQRSMTNSVMVKNTTDISKFIDNQNNIKIGDSTIEFVSIDDRHVVKPLDRLYDDVCSICSRPIFYEKYICCTCSNCVLCQQCEPDHIHPLIKCKGSHLSSLSEIYFFIKSHQIKPKKRSLTFENIFKKKDKYEFKLSVSSPSFSMRKNHKISIPINIENTQGRCFDQSNDLMLITRNNKDLKIDHIPIKDSFNPREHIEVNMTIESTEYCKLYNFCIELYSSRVVIECNQLKIKIDVNDNKEEDEINNFFEDYSKILMLPLEQKQMIWKIIDQNISTDHPYIIMAKFQTNNWDYDMTVKDIQEQRYK